MAYIVKADVAKYLNVTLGTSGENIVDSLIPAVEKAVDNYCGRTWSNTEDEDIVEKYDGGERIYYVKNPPIATVTSIKTNFSSTYTGDTLNAATDDYYIYDDHIELASTAYRGPRSVVITYKSSATAPPADVKQACIQWVAHLFKSATDGGKTVSNVGVGQMSLAYKVASDDIPDFVKVALNPYRIISL